VTCLTYEELNNENPLLTNDEQRGPYKVKLSGPGAESNLKVKLGTSMACCKKKTRLTIRKI
jgi:hypothetical protein